MKDNRPLTLDEFNAIRHRAAREHAEAVTRFMVAVRSGLQQAFAGLSARLRRGSIRL